MDSKFLAKSLIVDSIVQIFDVQVDTLGRFNENVLSFVYQQASSELQRMTDENANEYLVSIHSFSFQHVVFALQLSHTL